MAHFQGIKAWALRRVLGELLFREDAHFHTTQATEAAFNVAARLGPAPPEARAVLVAAETPRQHVEPDLAPARAAAHGPSVEFAQIPRTW